MKTISLILFLGMYTNCFAQESLLYPTFEQNTKLVLKLLDTLKNQFDTTYKLLHINDAIYHETFIYRDKRLDSFARQHNIFIETSFDQDKYLSPYADSGVHCITIDIYWKPFAFYVEFASTICDANREITGFKVTSELPPGQYWIYDKARKLLRKK